MEKTKDISSKEKKVSQILSRNADVQPVKSDKALRKSDTSSLSNHNEQYTELLKAYVEYFKDNSLNKNKNKQDLFKFTKRLLFWIPLSTIVLMFASLILIAYDKIDILEALPELITAMGTLIGTFMVIPKMITKYLFNKEEEKYLTEIIGKIQKYDRDIRDGL